MIYKTSDKEWVDANGYRIPVTRISKLEKFKEKAATTLLSEAQFINKKLNEYKEKMKSLCDQAYKMALEANKQDGDKPRKGNFTWFSFDRSVRIEVSINEKIEFESVSITAAKDKLEEFLNSKLTGIDEGVSKLLMDAFKSKNSQLDTKKVLGILSFKSKIKANLFQEVCECIEKSIQRSYSATYYRIAERGENGEYNYVELNFSAI